jgi:folate-binding protein YgfZ
MASPLLLREGAVEADGRDAGVASHYGDPLGEQRAAVRSVALVDRTHRGIVTVSGPDRLSWLHSIATQHLSALRPGVATETLVLSPNGHVEHHAVVVDDGTTTWLHVEPGRAGALVDFLRGMQFLLRVEVQDVTASYGILTLVGPAAGDIPLPADSVAFAAPGHVDVAVPRGALASVADGLVAAGASVAGVSAYEALRIAAHRPRFGAETDHRSIPNELGWLQTAVHLDKGCYRGQETVARVHNLGRPPRRLVFLHLDGSAEALPASGSSVEAAGPDGDARAIGFVGSAAYHWELGPIALAVVKRTVADGTTVIVGGPDERIAGRVEGVAAVPADGGARRDRPELLSF